MKMCIDEAGHHDAAAGVDHLSFGDDVAGLLNDPVPEQDGSSRQLGRMSVKDQGVLDGQRGCVGHADNSSGEMFVVGLGPVF
jgi:hypothetical protein